MKKVSLIIVAVFVSVAAMAQSRAAEAFYNKYKDDRDASEVNLNGSIFELISSIAGLGEDEDAETISRIAKGIKSMNILALPMDKAGISMKEIESLRSEIKAEKYDELMTVKDGRERVYFMAKTTDKQIQNMLIMISGDDDKFVLMNLDGILDMKDLAYLAEHRDKWSK